MGLYQRRRPTPIKIYPNPVRRQETEDEEPESASSPEAPVATLGPDSASTQGPDSASTLGPDSPDSDTSEEPEPATAPAQVSSSSPAPAVTGEANSSSSPASLVPTTSTSTIPAQAAAQASSSATSSSTGDASSSPSGTSPSPSTGAPAVTARPPTGAAVDVGDDAQEPDSPSSPTSPTSSSQPASSGNGPMGSSITSAPTFTNSAAATPGSQLAGESAGIDINPPPSPGHRIGKGAEAALITSAVLGFVALIVGAYFLYKRKRRREALDTRHAENGFAPDNNGGASAFETVHIGFDPGNAHVTRSTNNSNSLFGSSHYQRPETVSTNTNSRAAPLPTPNPFADPPRNKAFDQLRGRPRSTTLTDRGSWVKNPFQDPESDRFDPFGELQEKARQERIRYMQEVRQEDMARREREREQQFLEKERMGLEVPERARR